MNLVHSSGAAVISQCVCTVYIFRHIFMTCLILQHDLRQKVSILGCKIIGPCNKKVHINTFIIVNGYRVTAL
jgi:hypothetical protein